MTLRERAEATATQIIEMLKDAWDSYNARESDGSNVADMLDEFAAEAVAQERERCAAIASHAGLPEIAVAIRSNNP